MKFLIVLLIFSTCTISACRTFDLKSVEYCWMQDGGEFFCKDLGTGSERDVELGTTEHKNMLQINPVVNNWSKLNTQLKVCKDLLNR